MKSNALNSFDAMANDYLELEIAECFPWYIPFSAETVMDPIANLVPMAVRNSMTSPLLSDISLMASGLNLVRFMYGLADSIFSTAATLSPIAIPAKGGNSHCRI